MRCCWGLVLRLLRVVALLLDDWMGCGFRSCITLPELLSKMEKLDTDPTSYITCWSSPSGILAKGMDAGSQSPPSPSLCKQSFPWPWRGEPASPWLSLQMQWTALHGCNVSHQYLLRLASLLGWNRLPSREGLQSLLSGGPGWSVCSDIASLSIFGIFWHDLHGCCHLLLQL